ncbi:MAG: SDR family oxidoreductase, partial [Pseudomonadota bacterium]
MGLANDKSIAWGIAQALHDQGADIGVTYVGAPMAKRVGPLAQSINAPIVMDCDVGDPAAVAEMMQTVKDTWGHLDFIVHAIGFSDKSGTAKPCCAGARRTGRPQHTLAA